MNIDTNKCSHINDYDLENIPRVTPLEAINHLFLSKAMIFGMEIYLAKIIEVVCKSPECENDEKFWIECQVNRLINCYLNWFGSIIREFIPTIRISHSSVKQSIIEIKLNIVFKSDENNYSYSYFFTIDKEVKSNGFKDYL